jgi:hypothetical protein
VPIGGTYGRVRFVPVHIATVGFARENEMILFWKSAIACSVVFLAIAPTLIFLVTVIIDAWRHKK